MESRQKQDEAVEVTQEDLRNLNSGDIIYRQDMDMRLSRIESELDELLENQPRKAGN